MYSEKPSSLILYFVVGLLSEINRSALNELLRWWETVDWGQVEHLYEERAYASSLFPFDRFYHFDAVGIAQGFVHSFDFF